MMASHRISIRVVRTMIPRESYCLFCFSPAPFSRRRCIVDHCFAGHQPGNAIAVPAAPDVHEGLGQIQASAP